MQIMTIWTSNACIRKDSWHNLYGEVTTGGKLRCVSNGFTNGDLNSYEYRKIKIQKDKEDQGYQEYGKRTLE